ncbi:nucleotide-diphospho-sugar transferase [Candidatus Pacearchaeota archaeon]|nr:nucleotide-diphospho-sugar transferase [Candidatus Pacearchaeota archaeon]
MKKFKLTTPILYLVFNRLDTVKQTFQEIQKAKPQKLFIAADGPRTNEEKKKTDTVRKYILSKIDWDCKVKTLFRNKNLGCRYAVSSAIDWFFENVEQGIILEDDCLPDQSFFRFCQEMLDKYKDNEVVGQICGSNFLKDKFFGESYTFSKYGSIWGWATWRRAWKYYDVDLKDYGNFDKIEFEHNLNFLEKKLRKNQCKQLRDEGGDTWDFQWGIIRFHKGILNIIPKRNLIENIGFGEDGTHTKRKLKIGRNKENILFPLKHPKKIIRNEKYDGAYFKKVIFPSAIKSIIKSILKKLKEVIKG